MPSLQTSQDAKAKIKQARDEKGWNVDDQEPLKKASEVLTGETDWPKEIPNGYLYADGVSEATWKRFLYGTGPINTKVYKVFCEILNLNWKELVDDSPRSRRPANYDRADFEQFISDRQQKYPKVTDETAIQIIEVEAKELQQKQPLRWQKFLDLKRLWNGGKKAAFKVGEHYAEQNPLGKGAIAFLEGVMEDPK